ncbi:MAG: hypothetical protein K2H96_09425 [Muribaculaceae bacterium]|nr:hypothetical protein [Muribaculaceae bacterium]
MKKFYAFAATALMALAANAQNGKPLYATGNGEGLGWTPETPAEFVYANGKYTLEVKQLSQLKISTVSGSWDDFNSGVYGCDYGDKPGVAVPLQAGYWDNINTPWKADYTVTVAGDLSTITLTTASSKPVGPTPIYLRGLMNNWGASEEWEMTPVTEGKIYKFVCSDDQSISAGETFKIADEDWAKYNIGGTATGIEMNLNEEYEVVNGGNPADMLLAEDWNGICWLNLDLDGKACFISSNNKDFVPEWAGGSPIIPDDPIVGADKLYITGAGDFTNGAWNAANPDEFTLADGKFTIKVENLTQFKISTSCDPESLTPWDAFNAGAYGCEYGDKPGVTVSLIEGFDDNIKTPWKGVYTITVAGDLSSITLTTDTPKPEGTVAIYLRGDMSTWAAEPEWQMTAVTEGKLYKFICAEGQEVTPEDVFKIADDEWNEYNIGSDGEPIVLDQTTMVFNGGNPANIMLAQTWNGICWLNLDVDGEAYIAFSNDKTFVPDWTVKPDEPIIPDDPIVTADKLYITGAGDFTNGAWNAANPDEFTLADGKFTIKVENLTQFKISTSCDPESLTPWDAFNAGAYGCEYGDKPGVTVSLIEGFDDNIKTPWKGVYTITVAGDLSSITLTTDTPKPEGTVAIYLRGDMSTWAAEPEWQMTAVTEGKLYKFICAEGQEVTPEDVFKIADDEWNEYNIGSDGEPIVLDQTTMVFNGGNPANIMLAQTWNGICWLNLDVDGEAYIAFSNDKTFVPDWTVKPDEPIIPDDPIVPGDKLYITGAGDFTNGEWNAATPDEFTYADGKYTITVTNLTQFKISTSCDPEALKPWDVFNAGAYGCEYGDKPGVEVSLIEGYDQNIMAPWEGDYTIIVAGDLSTITLLTDTPKPEGPVAIYLRGTMNDWAATEEWQMTPTADEKVFKFECSDDQAIPADGSFKIADAKWNVYNIGGNGTPTYLNILTEVFNSSNPADIKLAEEWYGVCWLNLDFKGQAYIILSNDKYYIPDWENLSKINTVEFNNDDVKYFNLQGVQVHNPESGLFIEVRNGHTRKVMVK